MNPHFADFLFAEEDPEETKEEEDIASYNISSPAIRCEPIQNSSIPRFDCRQDKRPKRFTLMAPAVSKATWDLNMSPYAGEKNSLFATEF